MPNKTSFFFYTTVLLFILLSFLMLSVSGAVNQEVALSSISEAEQKMTRAYEAVLDAEGAGAKVSGLLARLNDAADMLSQGHMAFEVGDFEEAVRFAELSSEVCWEVLGEAESLEVEARNKYASRRRWLVAGSATGVTIVSITSLLGYEHLKRRHQRRLSKKSSEAGQI